MAVSWKKLKNLLLIVCFNRNRSALVCELLSYNSLFVGQFYEDKSLLLWPHDLIFFSTDLQTVSYYSTNHNQPGAIARSVAMSLGNQEAINPRVRHIFS